MRFVCVFAQYFRIPTKLKWPCPTSGLDRFIFVSFRFPISVVRPIRPADAILDIARKLHVLARIPTDTTPRWPRPEKVVIFGTTGRSKDETSNAVFYAYMHWLGLMCQLANINTSKFIPLLYKWILKIHLVDFDNTIETRLWIYLSYLIYMPFFSLSLNAFYSNSIRVHFSATDLYIFT